MLRENLFIHIPRTGGTTVHKVLDKYATQIPNHTLGVEASILSLGYNIDYIEKHFTVDNDLPGRDNKFAILPNQLKKLKKYVDIFSMVNLNHGSDYQECEEETREIYSGRWNG